MATKTKPKAKTLTLDEAIERVLAAGIKHDSIAELWLGALRTHEVEATARAQAWPGWDDSVARTRHSMLAQADHAAQKLARINGEAIPPMPFLDEMKVRQQTMTSTKATRATRASSGGGGSRTPKASGIRFTHDGKLVSETQNKLSSVAWFYTKPLGKGGGRMKVAELKKLLGELGVADPNTAGWSVKLPNGVTLGAVRAGETPTPIENPSQPKLAKATTAKKSPAKSTAKKATKAPTSKSVSALMPKSTPKKQTARQRAASENGAKKPGAASKPLAKAMAPRKARVAKAG